MNTTCSRCGGLVEIPDELVGDVDYDEYRSGVLVLVQNYFCDECEEGIDLDDEVYDYDD